MRINVHFHHPDSIEARLEIIMGTQAELLVSVKRISDQLTKATEEIKAAVASSGNTSPEVDAAVGKLATLAQSLDDINPDAPVAGAARR